MAQRAIININGDLIPFSENLDRIRTPGLGGSAVTWVPDADTICDQLKVTANGTYSAAEAGKYGYDYVVVSVPGSSVTGRDPDTGEEVEVHPDPETGEIVTTVLPTEIRVITPPAKTDYTNGETIDYSGIVVHAYSSTGQDMGAVPFEELVFPVTEADGDIRTDGAGLNAMQIAYTPHWFIYENGGGQQYERQVFCSGIILGTDRQGFPATFGGSGPGTLLITRYKGYNYAASLSGSKRVDLYTQLNGEPNPWGYINAHGFTHSGGTSALAGDMVFGQAAWNDELTEIPESTVNPLNKSTETLHAVQSLPVQWPRTPDGAVLETTTTINVTGGST